MKNPALTPQFLANAAEASIHSCRTQLSLDADRFNAFVPHLAAVKDFQQAAKAVCGRAGANEVLIAWLADMSCGKSTTINAVMGYPLLPVAKKATSSCPIEIRCGKPRLQVFAYQLDESSSALEGDTLFTFDESHPLTPGTVNSLLKYVLRMTQEDVLRCENLHYVGGVEDALLEDPKLICRDPLRVMQLCLVVLNAYIGQDNDALRQQREELIAQRNQLMSNVFGIHDPSMAYGVHVWLESDALVGGTVLVDLPGLGSDSLLHTAVTKHYTQRVDAFVLSFDAGALVNKVNDALQPVLQQEKMRLSGKDSRFIVLLNKCDLSYEQDPDFYADDLAKAARDIHPLLSGIETGRIYPFSARYGEYRMLAHGIAPQNTFKGRKLKRISPTVTDDQLRAALYADYNTEFSYRDSTLGVSVTGSTKSFIEEVIAGRAPQVAFLNAFGTMSETVACYSTLLAAARMQLSLLQLQLHCGDDLMNDLLGQIIQALEGMKKQFHIALTSARKVRASHVQDLNDTLDNVMQTYQQSLRNAQTTMNDDTKKLLLTMKSNLFGDCIIEGKRCKRAKNAESFEQLINRLENFDLKPYLETGDKQLKDALRRARNSLSQFVKDLYSLFAKHTSSCRAEMDVAYANFMHQPHAASMPDDMRQVFDDCFAQTCDSIESYLNLVSEELLSAIRYDTSLDDVINDTITDLPDFLHSINNFYHDKCTGYVTALRGSTILRGRSTLNIDKMLADIDKPFVSDSENHQQFQKLERMLTATHVSSSHISRFNAKFNTLMNNYEVQLSQKLDNILPMLEQDLHGQFTSTGAHIAKHAAQLNQLALDAAKSLKQLCEKTSHTMQACDIAASVTWCKDAGKEVKDKLIRCLADWNTLAHDAAELISSH
ncbi:MAG: dynamin family protein [Clostridia bacterium]|nr:dynamin family protein [Clostridia bacterium]